MALKEKYLIILLLALTETQCYASKNTMHNVTVHCGDSGFLMRTVSRCQRELAKLSRKGSVWFGRGSQTRTRDNQTTRRNVAYNIKDSLDALSHACYIEQRSRKCLEENGVRDYCLSISNALDTEMDFQFICRCQQLDENLIRSLQCLRDKRVLVMLFFHIGNHCFRGMDILDDLMTRVKNAYFYQLDINTFFEATYIRELYCLPRHVISTCVRDFVQDHCGKRTSELVQNYLLYSQHRFRQALKSAGLSSNICEYNIRPKSTVIVAPTSGTGERQEELGFVRGVEMAAAGTALDTVMGRRLVAHLQNVSEQDICSDPLKADIAYTICLMSSDDKYERSTFNILQFAHAFFTQVYHGTYCLRQEQFTVCWNLLQQMCGPKVRLYKQHATLLVEGCKIQSEMDTAGCHWQDMLLRHYFRQAVRPFGLSLMKFYVILSLWNLDIPPPGL